MGLPGLERSFKAALYGFDNILIQYEQIPFFFFFLDQISDYGFTILQWYVYGMYTLMTLLTSRY